MTAGILHGALLLATVGAALGAASGRLVKGLPIGALAGIGGALSYYALIVVMDSRTYGTAIPGAWVIMWLLLAALEGRWLRAPDCRGWAEIAIRGVVAAVAGGLAFVLVRNILWGRPPGEGRNYLRAIHRLGGRVGAWSSGAHVGEHGCPRERNVGAASGKTASMNAAPSLRSDHVECRGVCLLLLVPDSALTRLALRSAWAAWASSIARGTRSCNVL